MSKRPTGNAKGFTVIELLVATAVFGLILVVVTVAVIQFTKVYYKGITEAATQDTARTIVDRISQSIQFNGGNVTETPSPRAAGATAAFCVGNQQYTYVAGHQLTDSAPVVEQTRHALVVRDLAGCTSSSPTPNMSSISVPGRELLAPKMRLAVMEVKNVGANLYKVRVKVVHGDRDLLNNPTSDTANCQTAEGSRFCAVSDITTVVTKRVE